jgi:hypothetical protein
MTRYWARMRVVSYQEWIVTADSEEEARKKLIEHETDDVTDSEIVDWRIDGPVQSEKG